ncbi:MAG: tRNA dihydrouridine synthase DusB [Candidatus Desulforudis sp.]|nr:tRNA dihydrouridine synthase DusB [Desulforudis sp.]
MTFKIGGVTLANRVFAAPMAGITDRAFRELAREMGCGLTCTEMISSQALMHGSRRTAQILDIAGEYPISVQIFGSNPGILARAAQLVVEAGADLVDINMGCPTPKIVKTGEGAALMRDPRRAGDIVAAVVAAVPVPVTVKMRRGWDAGYPDAVELARVAEEAGAAAVTLHGRFRSEFYGGKADWNIIRAVKQAVNVPVIGNGDVRSGPDAVRMLADTGCDAVMVGRAARGNPWIFREILDYVETGEELRPPTPEERVTMALRHFDLLVRYKGEARAVLEMRKYLAWYTRGLHGAARLRERLHAADSAAVVRALAASISAASRQEQGF